MRRHGFAEKDIESVEVYAQIKVLLQSEEFKIESEDKKDNFWDLHARKSSAERIVLSKVRDVDVVIAGIYQLDGLLFNSGQELHSHAKIHEQQQQMAQGSMMNSMLMMSMLGGAGMFGMGMAGGLWI